MAAKRLNKNVVMSLTLFAFVMMIVTAVLMLRQVRQRDPQYFEELGQRYSSEGQWQTAALFYRKAWERSRDAAYLVDYGDAILADGEVRLALGAFREALINQPDLTAAHVRYIEVLLEQARLYGSADDWRRVREAAQGFLDSGAGGSEAQEAFAHHSLGLALAAESARGGRPEGASEGEAQLRRAVAKAPEVARYAIDLARHLVHVGERDEGEQLFQALLARYASESAEAGAVRVAYADYLSSQRRFDEAEEALKSAMSVTSEDPDALRDARLGYAAFLSQRWRLARQRDPDTAQTRAYFDQAERVLTESIASYPDDFAPHLALVNLYAQAGRHEDIEAVCKARLDRGLSRRGIQAARNRVHAFQLYIFACEACVARAATAQEASDREQRDRWLQQAEEYLAGAKGESPSHPRVLAQSGRIKLARGLTREALRDLRAADEAYRAYDTIDWDNKLTLARVHLALNQPGAAREALEGVLDRARRERSGDATFWTLYAQSLLATGETDRALTLADQILLVRPDHAEALRVKAAAYERVGRLQEAGKIMASVTGDPVVEVILTAQERSLEGDHAGARALLREALERRPADARLVRAMLRELLTLNQTEPDASVREALLGEARAIAESAVQRSPDDPQLRALAVLVREDLTDAQRDDAILEIIEAQPDPFVRAAELAGFYRRQQDPQKTLQLLNTALKHLADADTPAAQRASPAQHRALLTSKLAAAAALNDEAAMDEARDAAAKHNVDGAGGRMIAGLYHLHRREYNLAIAALREMVKADPTDPRALIRLGQALQMAGRTDEAGDLFERAVHINPTAGQAHRGLAMLAEAQGDQAAYDRALSACERYLPNDPWVKRALLERQEAADPHAAIVRRQQLLKEKPDDVRNLRRLAVLCESAGDLAGADRYYARLVELEPDDKALAISVANYYRRTERPQKALAAARRYVDSRQTPQQRADAVILVASHYVHVGEPEKAESTLREAAKTAETFDVANSLAEFYLQLMDQPHQAMPWLQKAVRAAGAPGDDDLRSIRLARAMAARVACALHRDMDDISAARKYLDELLARFPDDPRGKLLESEYFARTGRMDAAVDALAAYLRARPDDRGARFQRALHHLALGQTGPAIADLQFIKRAEPLALELRPRFLLARLHRDAGRNDLWVRELETLATDAPDDDRALRALVAAYGVEDRLADAERLITARINRAAENDVAVRARLRFLRGDVALQDGNPSAAVADYLPAAQLAGFSPEAVARVMGLYLTIGRPVEADEYYRRHGKTLSDTPTLLARHAAVLAAMDQKSEAVQRFREAIHLAVSRAGNEPADVAGDAGRSGERVVPTGAEVVADLLSAFALDEAITLLEKQPGEGPLDPANDELLVHLYQRAGRMDEAIARADRLLDSAAGNRERASRLRQLGDLYQHARQADQARRAYEESLQYVPDDWMTLNNLAYLLCDQVGEHEAARDHARRAVRLAPNADTHDTLGWALVGLGEFAAAMAELNRAIHLNPDEPLPYYHLAEAYRRSGRMRDAADVLATGRSLARRRGDTDLVALLDATGERVAASDANP